MSQYKRWPIGLQSGPTGRPDGIGLVIDALTEAKIATFSASSDSMSILFDLQEAHKNSGVPHTANWIPTGYSGKSPGSPGYHLSVPRYGVPHSVGLAVQHWNEVESHKNGIPQEIDWEVPCVWLSTWNEVRPYVGWARKRRPEDGDAPIPIEDPVEGYEGNADLIGWQAYEIGKEALKRGYRWAAFGFAGGDPEEGFWKAPGVQAYLELCDKNPDQLGIALHEYSHVDTIVGLPDKIGRFQQLHDVCDELGLRRPVIQIKEFGWRERRIPPRDEAIAQLIQVAGIYMQHPNIHGAAIWSVQNGWHEGLSAQVRDLIPHLQTAALAHAQPIQELVVPTAPIEVLPPAPVIDEPQFAAQWPYSILTASPAEAESSLTASSDEFGIDVSHWQRDLLNWNQLKQDGVRFAFIRVGSGHMTQDPNYVRNVSACLQYDIPFGNYFYLYADVDVKKQARVFVHQADWRSTLPPVVDVEEASLTAEQIKTFIDEFHRLVDSPPIMIYTRAGLWNNIVPRSENWPRKHPLWVAHWGTNKPLLPHHWDRWLFFQPGVKTGLAGYPQGNLDYNHFNGAISELTEVVEEPRARAAAFNDYIPFDSPVGSREQRRRKEKMYPGAWFDANPFGNLYTNPQTGNQAYHTGSDLNKNSPSFDADRHEPVQAAAAGVVTFAGTLPVWGGVVVIKHNTNVYSRYGHVENIVVQKGKLLKRGQKIAQVGRNGTEGSYHLHFDISLTDVLESEPGHWPGLDLAQLERHYVDPADYIERHRPQDTTPAAVPRLPVPTQFGFVTAQFLNLRSEASSAKGPATVLQALPQNTKVGIYNQLANGWYHVRVGNQEGYVAGKYISDVPFQAQLETTGFQTGMNVNPDAAHSNPTNGNTLRGMNWVRFVFKLSDRINAAERGDIDKAFAQYDPIVRAYSNMGVKSLIVINQETHHGSPREEGIDWAAFSQEFANVAGQIAAHYQEYGDSVAYQIWNEADLAGSSFSIYLEPGEYARLLRPTAAAIRAASPQALVIFNGMATGPDAAVNYIKAVRQQLGGSLPVDAIGIHPYGRWATRRPFQDWGFGTLANAFDFYRAHLPGQRFWITEIGIAGDMPIGSQHYPAVADYLADVYKHVGQQYADMVPVLIWFAWSDNMHNAGVVDSNGNPKDHIFTAFEQVRDRELLA